MSLIQSKLPSLWAPGREYAYAAEYLADHGNSFAPISVHLTYKAAEDAALGFGGITRVIPLIPQP